MGVVTIAEPPQQGAVSDPNSVTVSFPSAVAGDLLVFCYAVDNLPGFGPYDWFPNSGWTKPGALNTGLGVNSGAFGVLYHIVQTGETSWTPVNNGGNAVPGGWLCYRIQGHSKANPIINGFIQGSADFYPTTCPGADNPGVLGMAFALRGINSGQPLTVSGGYYGGSSFATDTQLVSLNGTLVVAHLPLIDNITPVFGSWDANTGTIRAAQFIVQPAPDLGPTDTAYIERFEVAWRDVAPVSGHLSFETSWTPTPGNVLLVIASGTSTFPGSVSGWNVIVNTAAIWAAYRTVQAGDGTSWDFGASSGGAGYEYIYELTNVQYQGEASGSAISPLYTTPDFISPVGPTICFYAVGVIDSSDNMYPQWGVTDGQTPDGCAVNSFNAAGHTRVSSACSHQITRAGGSASTGLAAFSINGYGATIVFSLGPVPCPVPPPATTLGILFPDGAAEARVSVYNADFSVNQIEVRDDLAGGRIQYEDTPSGCGSATLTLGSYWEQMVAPGGSITNAYWLARNIVEISAWDDVVQASISSGATKIYVGSRYGYDPLLGQDDQQIILDDGVHVTYRIPVTGVGTDGGGDFITVGAPGVYPGHPSSIPAYAAGTKIFRRRYTGIIMRRGLFNSRQPQGQISLTGLAQYLNEAVGTFTFNIDEVGNAIYNSIAQFVDRWPTQLIIDPANFPYTAQAYSGSNQQYTLADEVTQILSGGISNGDKWVVRVGHDRVVRLKRLFSQSCDAYDYVLDLRQGRTYFEAQFVSAEDEDVSTFYNSIEVTGDTNPTTKQPYGAIVQDATSIALFGQVDGAPISNTSCKSDDDCALYGQALLSENAIPRNNFKVKVFTFNQRQYPASPPMGLPRGDVILGVHAIKVHDFEGGAPNIVGLCQSVVTTMEVGHDSYQEAQFAAIEPNWNQAVRERAGKLALTLRHNVLVPTSVDSYYVGEFAEQLAYSPTSLNVLVGGSAGFQVVFAAGSSPMTIAQSTQTMQPSTTNYLWLNTDGSFTLTYNGEVGNPQPSRPPNPTCLLHSIYQTSSSGVLGHIFKAPKGPI